MASPAALARRRARRQRVAWTLALLVVLVAAVWVGHLVWDEFFNVVEPASNRLTP